MLKVFVTEKHGKDFKEFFLLQWDNGYVQFWHEWDQVKFKKFNWITFVICEFEIERQLGDGFTIELGLLGFRLRINALWNDSEMFKKIQKDAKEVKRGIAEGKGLKELGLKKFEIK